MQNHSCLTGNTGTPAQQSRGANDEIVADRSQISTDNPETPLLSRVELELVRKIDLLKKRIQLVKTIRPATKNPEREIDLGG